MHEDIIRQRFEEYYCDEYNMERLERHGNGFYISPLAKREWKTWKTAYASMREIEEQPTKHPCAVARDAAASKLSDLGIIASRLKQPARRVIPAEELTDAELALIEKQVNEMPEPPPYDKGWSEGWDAAMDWCQSHDLIRDDVEIPKYTPTVPAAPDKAMMEEMAGAINREWIAVDKSQEGIPLCEFGHGGVWVALPFETLEVLRRAARQALSKYRNAAPAAPDSGEELKLTDEWLGKIGFKYTQEERQPTKHWSLTLGWGAPDTNACMDDLCIEVASGALNDGWFCWLRRGTGFSDKFIHVRHIRYRHELEEMITALTGTRFKTENCMYGNFYNDKIAAKLQAEYAALSKKRGG